MKNHPGHINIPIFIPHLGCPNMCVFCNQRYISGVEDFVPDQARAEIEKIISLPRADAEYEIAFFGGSFTGIDRGLMIELLSLAQEYVDAGKVSGIRMSTRPDYIDDEIISVLLRHTVSAVELGIQSTDDRVLALSKRGHTAEDSRIAMAKLRKAGIATVGQMMIGLPGASRESEIKTARDIASLGASAARIYPTVVFKNTELCDMLDTGKYTALPVEEAVLRSADVLEVFLRSGVETLRIGLCESENLHSDETFCAGPNHPSLGELVYSEIYRRIISNEMEKGDYRGRTTVIRVPCGDISQAVGQRAKNKEYILESYGVKSVKFMEDETLNKYEIRVET